MKLKLLTISIIIFFSGCYAKELKLVEPIVDIKATGAKSILFIGFKPEKNINFPNHLNNYINKLMLKNLEKFNSIEFISLTKEEKPFLLDDVSQLNEEYKTDLAIVSKISAWKEYKFIDQQYPQIDSNIDNNNNSFNLQRRNNSTVRYSLILKGTFYLLNKKGKVIWQYDINENQTINYENEFATLSNTSKEEKELYMRMKNKIIDKAIDRITNNLLPYYKYD